MPIYKVLSIGCDLVFSDDELWESLQEALNELAIADWEIQHIPGVSLPDSNRYASKDIVASAVLINRTRSSKDELGRKFTKLKGEIFSAENQLNAIPPPNEFESLRIRMLIGDLEKKADRLQLQLEAVG